MNQGRRNVVWDNGGLGIHADVAGADPLPWIVLDDVTATTIEGSLDLPVSLPPPYFCVRAEIELFASDACDPSGRGEGCELVDEIELAGCPSSFVGARAQATYAHPVITATASWVLGIPVGAGTFELPPVSSDFSNCVADPVPEPGFVWQLAAGIGMLALLERRRRRGPRSAS